MSRLFPRIPELFSAILDDLAGAAQSVYDEWNQVDGWDEELGEGGICQDVASRMVELLAERGIEDALSVHSSVGENHVFVVALLPGDGVYSIDIPPQVYEIGSGYTWKKREGVNMNGADVVINRVGEDMSPDQFIAAYSE